MIACLAVIGDDNPKVSVQVNDFLPGHRHCEAIDVMRDTAT